MYTEGKIIDGFMTEKDIRLVTESIFWSYYWTEYEILFWY